MDEQARGPAVHDGYAITSLVLGLLWLGGIGSVLAVVFGAMSEVGAHRKNRKASGLALAGQLLGAAGLIGLIVIVKHR
jgi:Domain of unknown function (DUF4190)